MNMNNIFDGVDDAVVAAAASSPSYDVLSYLQRDDGHLSEEGSVVKELIFVCVVGVVAGVHTYLLPSGYW